MEKRTVTFAATLTLIGSVLIFANTLLVAWKGEPIILSTHTISSITELSSNSPLVARIVFGLSSIVESPLMALWLIFATINLLNAIVLYHKPEKPTVPSLLIFILSLLSIFIGGGFIIGLVFATVGAVTALQSRRPLGDTFFAKLIRAAKLETSFFRSIKEKRKLMREAAFAVLFINFLSWLGFSLYIYNVNNILKSTDNAFQILALGKTLFDLAIFDLPLIFLGIEMLKWLFLAALLYLIPTKLLGCSGSFDHVAEATAFAYAPLSLQIFLPVVLSNSPLITLWPLTVYFIVNFWLLLALTTMVKAIFNMQTSKALGIVILGGTVFWLTTNRLATGIFATGGMQTNIQPGVQFSIQPDNLLYFLVSGAIVLSFLLGAFKRE